MADEETKLLMTVPKDVIDAQVKAAVASVLNKDPEALVRAVVHAAMTAKKDHYSRQPIWQDELDEMIRKVAQEEFRAWCEEQRPTIAKAIREKLKGSTKNLVETISTKMATGLTNMHFHISWPDSR